MFTQTPTAIEQTMTLLIRLSQRILTSLQLQQSPFIKSIVTKTERDQIAHHSSSPLYQISQQIETLLKFFIRRIDQDKAAYEKQLQKLQERLRKHAKNHCEMKLYCQHLQEELKNVNLQKSKIEKQFSELTNHYNKQIETLKTELSNAMLTRHNQPDKIINSERATTKPGDTLSKIKLRLMNLGTVEFDEPQSCANTMRKSIPCVIDQHPYSQPTSYQNSPKNSLNKSSKIKQSLKSETKINNKKMSKNKLGSKIIKCEQFQKSNQSIKTKKMKKNTI